MTERYLIASVYLKKERIQKYFKKLGWSEANPKDIQLTLLYLDSMKIYEDKYYKYRNFLKNQIGDDKHLITDKSLTPSLLPKKYSPMTLNINLKRFRAMDYFKYFKDDKIWILKPSRGREGIGIKILTNFADFEDYLKGDYKQIDFKKIKRLHSWVLQEYIVDPLLYKGRKFHLRAYFMVMKGQIYVFDKYIIATANKEYEKKNFDNIDIHDSHYNEQSLRNLIFPDDFEDKEENIKNIQGQVMLIFKNIKKNLPELRCYKEDKNCYEVMAADIMVTSNYHVKLLELNHGMGYPATMDRKYPLFENQLDIALGHFYDFKRSDENHFVKV